ncbi:sulfur carrier protein ThiS [Saccharomonospora xinjiangensis]|uniref:Thiamine biosynthesis protein ThiS n=1 Tax=Saccharomonospora xinjiangensis XJ-54 TaxID=882086 RepID=I0V402_9PSEU|nr:sulfur carrier protein ThiS [Saccharomonospora xinjiangensis]EID54855.1 thiamine biosynthesis protein ThiS [Saccharomonospora xinjiangensis XJ-54]QBQ62182.1 sulfur carrier protein ThiS [Saccharomonospora xinjiangensis]
MRVFVNGESRQLPDGSTVADVLAIAVGDAKGVAVAVDGEVIRRGAWGEVEVVEGAAVEILTAVQGG